MIAVLSSRNPFARCARSGVLAILLVFLFFPVYWLIVTAFKSQSEIFVVIPSLWPEHPTFENFVRAFSRTNLLVYLRNSLLTAGGSALVTTLIAAMAGFGFAKYKFRWQNSLMLAVLGSQMFPFGVILLSLYGYFVTIGLQNSLLGLTISYMAFSLPPAIYMLYGFFVNLPDELLEAARIDGATEFVILRRIVLPMSGPPLIAVGVYSFMWAWNDLLYSLTLVTNDDKRTIGPGLLMTFFGEMQQDWAAAMAASILASLPVVAVFGFLQKYFVQGLSGGALKS